MLSKALPIIPLLALGAMAPNLQEARGPAVPVAQVQAVAMSQAKTAEAPQFTKKVKRVVKRDGTTRVAKKVVKRTTESPGTVQPSSPGAA
jgi:hypothetical protein